MNPEELKALIQQMRDSGVASADIVAALQKRGLLDAQGNPVPPPPGMLESAARGAGQGFFRLGDNIEAAVRSKMGMAGSYDSTLAVAKQRNAAARQANPGSYLAGETVGMAAPAVAGAMLAPAGAPALAAAAMGGATTALGATEGDPRSIIPGAAIGSLGYGAGALGGTVLGKGFDKLFPKGAVQREIGGQMTAPIAERVALQEQLAPGSVVPTDLTVETAKLARPIAQAGPQVTRRVLDETGARIDVLQEALNAVAAKYPAPAELTPMSRDLQKVMVRRGLMPPAGAHAQVGPLMEMRTQIRNEIDAARQRIKVKGLEKPGDRALVRRGTDDVSVITAQLEAGHPGIKQVDKEYAALAEARRGANRTGSVLTKAQGTNAANTAMGHTPVSGGGNITSGSMWDKIMAATGIQQHAARTIADVAASPTTPMQLSKLMRAATQPERASLMGLLTGNNAPAFAVPPLMRGLFADSTGVTRR